MFEIVRLTCEDVLCGLRTTTCRSIFSKQRFFPDFEAQDSNLSKLKCYGSALVEIVQHNVKRVGVQQGSLLYKEKITHWGSEKHTEKNLNFCPQMGWKFRETIVL